MEIREIKNKEVWEEFLSESGEKTFLSSWNWGEFQKSMGSGSNGKIWRMGVFDRNELVSVALAIKVVARRGTFLLIPHGPNIKSKIKSQKSKILETLSEKLKEMGRSEKADFIRINPILERSKENEEIFKKLKFRQAPVHAHPEASWKLDISLSEDRLLGQMRKTTRYLIRQSQKDKDIEIYQGKEPKDVEVFNKIHLEVVKVQKFIPFSLDYFRKEFSSFSGDDEICIFFAKYKGEIAAASYVIFWSGVGFYHHAALLPECHKIPLAYALQWESIKEAKRRGCKLYDFWGYVNPQESPNHPWAGPTLFKMGFGGRAHEYVNTQDFPLSKKYWLTYFFEKLRKIKRGYN
ncbi:MAG: peptidoglycan bridge formation glycyltransferase FemA/FemB family protein [Candidatus Nealsonbacteria bacterium]|nr:peptidoglycan bridge formation glycyltransferase FemA/FemB family protein [Candidatus Nealsonbacteria bacterium]